jgi:hypothetical protein
MDKAIWGVPRWGFFRWGVTVTKFDVALEQLKKAHPPTFSDAVKVLKRIT